MNRFLRSLFVSLSLMFIVLSVVTAQGTNPSVIPFPSSVAPPVPPDLKVMCTPNPNTGAQSATCPVIAWNGYIYWVFSFTDNRIGMSIVAYTEDGTFVKRWDKSGARYISKISSDRKKRTFTLVGQSAQTIVVNWDDLYLPISPDVARYPSSVHPAIPAGSKMTCAQSADVIGKMDSCTVLQWNEYTYWAYSYNDNRVSLNIVAYNDTGAVVQQWEAPGARYIYNITVDPAAQNVTFWGQANQKAVMKWSDLLIK